MIDYTIVATDFIEQLSLIKQGPITLRRIQKNTINYAIKNSELDSSEELPVSGNRLMHINKEHSMYTIRYNQNNNDKNRTNDDYLSMSLIEVFNFSHEFIKYYVELSYINKKVVIQATEMLNRFRVDVKEDKTSYTLHNDNDKSFRPIFKGNAYEI